MAVSDTIKDMPIATLNVKERVDRKEQFNNLAGKLNTMAAQAEKMKSEVPLGAQDALQKIANSARDGEKKLRVMAED